MSTPAERPAPVDVLITEDDPGLRQMLRVILEHDGYRCAEAENGLEAVELARACHPRLVLLDLMMPGLDGFTVARQLRSDSHTDGIQIYFLTARADDAARRKAERVGCEAFFTKPFDCADLLDVIHVTLN
jgi:CheY-like chemotaxis protein